METDLCERCGETREEHDSDLSPCEEYAVRFVPGGTRHDTARYQMKRDDADALSRIPSAFYAPGIKQIIEEVLRGD